MFKLTSRAYSCLTVLAMLACTVASRAIVNGEVTNEYRQVGQVLLTESGQPNYLGNCILVAPTLAITSAELAKIIDDKPKGNSVVVFDGQVRNVLELFIHPDYNPSTLQHNVAIISFSAPILAVEPMRLLRRAPLFGEVVTIVGNGSSNPQGARDDQTSRTRRVANVTLSEISGTEVAWDVSSASDSTIGPGDAAAALLVDVNGVPHLAAVASRHTRDDFGVGDTVYNARVDNMIDWIEDPLPGPQTVVYRIDERLVVVGGGDRQLIVRRGFLAVDRLSREAWAIFHWHQGGKEFLRVEPWQGNSQPSATAASGREVEALEVSGEWFLYTTLTQQKLSDTTAELRNLGGVATRLIYGFPAADSATGSTLLASPQPFGTNAVATGTAIMRLDRTRTFAAQFTYPRNVIDNPNSDNDIASNLRAAFPRAIYIPLPEENHVGSVDDAAISLFDGLSESAQPAIAPQPFRHNVYVYIVTGDEQTIGAPGRNFSRGIGALIISPDGTNGDADQAMLIMGFKGARPGLRTFDLRDGGSSFGVTRQVDSTSAQYYKRFLVGDRGGSFIHTLVASGTQNPFEKLQLFGLTPIEEFPLTWAGEWTAFEPGRATIIKLNAQFDRNRTVNSGFGFSGVVTEIEQLLQNWLGIEDSYDR